MKTSFLIIIGMILIGSTSDIFVQYMGGKYPTGTLLEECIGGPGMCPEQQLAERLENDQKNALFIIAIGIPLLGAIAGFVAWTRRKNL